MLSVRTCNVVVLSSVMGGRQSRSTSYIESPNTVQNTNKLFLPQYCEAISDGISAVLDIFLRCLIQQSFSRLVNQKLNARDQPRVGHRFWSDKRQVKCTGNKCCQAVDKV